MAIQIQLRRDTATNWTTNDPVLANGEIGIDTTVSKFKIGDGSTTWNSLSFVSGTSDNTAIHDNVAGEINAITEKVTPVDADLLIIEDSEDSNNKKKVQMSSLPGGGGGDFDDGGEAGGADRSLGNTDNFDLSFLTNNSNRLHIDSSGNVGIGTASPGSTLDVYGEIRSSRDASQFLRLYSNSSGHYLVGNGGTNKSLFINSHSVGTSPIAFQISGTSKMVLDSSGNVGIGTTSPTAKCDINSDILRLRTSKTPASATATGNQGDIAWDSNYMYICVATNSWKRSALLAW